MQIPNLRTSGVLIFAKLCEPKFQFECFTSLQSEMMLRVKDYEKKYDRVGGGVAPAVLPHHLAYGSVPRRFLPNHSVSALLPVFL